MLCETRPSFALLHPAKLWKGSRMDIEHIFREESGRILATLIRLLGSFDLAEEVMQEAFTTALEQWPTQGTPARMAGFDGAAQGSRSASAPGAV